MTNVEMNSGTETAPAYVDISTSSFVIEVIEASKTQPVLVDFWAPWCGPCKQLAPLIETIVGETNGSVKLAKMDIDKHPDVAGQMGLQSIPAVVAFVDGRPADHFMGAKSESEIRAFVEKIAGPEVFKSSDPTADMLEAGLTMLQAGEYSDAASQFAAILQVQPEHTEAKIGMGECYLAIGQLSQARGLADSLTDEQQVDPLASSFLNKLELAEKADLLGDLDELAAKVAADPKDNQAAFDYAVALNGHDKREDAAEQLLTIIRRDRKWQEDGARSQLIQFFESWGAMDPAAVSARRALSSILFS